jgi:hypothetical protein
VTKDQARLLTLVFQAFDQSPHIPAEDMEPAADDEVPELIEVGDLPRSKVVRFAPPDIHPPPPAFIQLMLIGDDCLALHEGGFLDVMLKDAEGEGALDADDNVQTPVWMLLHADDTPDHVLSNVTGFLDLLARSMKVI